MKYLEELKESACKELERYAKTGEITVNSLDKIQKLTDVIKNIEKIEMLEDGEYSEDWIGEGRIRGGTSYARGRRGYVKRDSMGRYSRGDRDYYSEDSRADAKEHILDKIGEMMEGADPNEREALKRAMRALEQY